MSNNWYQAYTELTDFIAEHSEIKIGVSVVRTPDSVRPEFYRLFNTVRTAFIEEKFPALLSEVRVLNESYTKAEQDVTKLLGLNDVSMEASLHRFLHDPIDELIRGLFDPLFDLMKAKVGIETFEERASQNIEASFQILYQSGYEKWVALSLLKLLEADKSFQVILRKPNEIEELSESSTSEEEVPPTEKSECLSFEQEPSAVFIVPDLIVHSARVNRYIAIRQQIGRALATASNASQQRKWYPLDSVVALGPGLNLVYVDDNPVEISLVADAEKICRPDLIIECKERKDWYEEEGLEKVKLYHDSLKPTLGTYIVSRELVPEQELNSQEEDIHLLIVGFDQSKLEPIVSALQPESK